MKNKINNNLIYISIIIAGVFIVSLASLLELPTYDKTLSYTSVSEPIIYNSDKININTAVEKELILLEGIGEIKARKIVEYRGKNGEFKYTYQIRNVEGITYKIYIKIKDKIEV